MGTVTNAVPTQMIIRIRTMLLLNGVRVPLNLIEFLKFPCRVDMTIPKGRELLSRMKSQKLFVV